ncbi:MAG: hypothetical protein IPK53_17575 [bacterium]|nr:hypothetical protein [bacterium]
MQEHLRESLDRTVNQLRLHPLPGLVQRTYLFGNRDRNLFVVFIDDVVQVFAEMRVIFVVFVRRGFANRAA